MVDPADGLLAVVAALERLAVPYFVGGSIASFAHGVTRSTLGADVIVDRRPEQVEPLVNLLEGRFYADAAMLADAARRRGSANLIHYASGLKIDLFLLGDRPYDHAQMARRVRLPLLERPSSAVYVATAEDIVLAKLEWYRAGGEVSDRQWQDIRGVIRTQGGRLDSAYLRRWAPGLGVADLLARALDDSR